MASPRGNLGAVQSGTQTNLSQYSLSELSGRELTSWGESQPGSSTVISGSIFGVPVLSPSHSQSLPAATDPLVPPPPVDGVGRPTGTGRDAPSFVSCGQSPMLRGRGGKTTGACPPVDGECCQERGRHRPPRPRSRSCVCSGVRGVTACPPPPAPSLGCASQVLSPSLSQGEAPESPAGVWGRPGCTFPPGSVFRLKSSPPESSLGRLSRKKLPDGPRLQPTCMHIQCTCDAHMCTRTHTLTSDSGNDRRRQELPTTHGRGRAPLPALASQPGSQWTRKVGCESAESGLSFGSRRTPARRLRGDFRHRKASGAGRWAWSLTALIGLEGPALCPPQRPVTQTGW